LVGPDGAGDEARFAVLGGDAGRGGARQPGALQVHLIGDAGEVVIGLRNRGRGKRVGGDDVGAGAQIFGVDVLDRFRLRQDQQVVVAPEVAVEIRITRAAKRSLVIFEALDHGAHGAVEHQDALAGRREQGNSFRRDWNGHRIKRLSGRPAGEYRANG
jgi:hypothetical protein